MTSGIPKMQALIRKAQAGLIRKRFTTSEELVTALYAALVEYLDSEDFIRSETFDAAPCLKASLDDLDSEQNGLVYPHGTQYKRLPVD